MCGPVSEGNREFAWKPARTSLRSEVCARESRPRAAEAQPKCLAQCEESSLPSTQRLVGLQDGSVRRLFGHAENRKKRWPRESAAGRGGRAGCCGTFPTFV